MSQRKTASPRVLFPERVGKDRIAWLGFVRNDQTDPFSEHCTEREACDVAKLTARMHEWGHQGDWNSRVGFVKRLELPRSVKKKGVVIYEIKSHQDRVLFIRHGVSAVVVAAMVKKDDWSKKDARVLEVAVENAIACGARDPEND